MGKPRLVDLQAQSNYPRRPLDPAFFDRDTLIVARHLLGCLLLRWWPETGEWLTFRVVETEAYTADDPACHAYNRRTGRAAMLYAHPGTAYVYLIYGMYDCLNAVTEAHGTAGAVLFRAVQPVGHEHPKTSPWRTYGPGRLTRALQITRDPFNGRMLTDPATGLYLAEGEALPESAVVRTTRIGITQAADYPWRFYEKDNPWVSVK
jgi:DNA-3-methyladenine glycosylase